LSGFPFSYRIDSDEDNNNIESSNYNTSTSSSMSGDLFSSLKRFSSKFEVIGYREIIGRNCISLWRTVKMQRNIKSYTIGNIARFSFFFCFLIDFFLQSII
jgi:hypothetical protein